MTFSPILLEPLAQLVDRGEVVGLAAALVRDDDALLAAFGHSGVPERPDPSHDTFFDVGSITKTFTATVFASLVAEGTLSYSDPLSSYVPAGIHVPGGDDAPILLGHLATHTSGLPRIPADLAERAEAQIDDPYRNETPQHLLASLARSELTHEPGAAVSYSNFGYAVLAYVMTRATGRTLAQLIRERVCAPLGMEETSLVRPTGERKALGHRQGLGVADWNVGAYAGAGGVWSTAADMLVYLRAQIDPDATAIGDVIRETQRPRVKMSEHADAGLAWITLWRTPEIVWHNGGSGGFGAFIGFSPTARAGIVVLTNSEHHPELDATAARIVQSLAPA